MTLEERDEAFADEWARRTAGADAVVFDFGGVISVAPDTEDWPVYDYCASRGVDRKAFDAGWRSYRHLYDGGFIGFPYIVTDPNSLWFGIENSEDDVFAFIDRPFAAYWANAAYTIKVNEEAGLSGITGIAPGGASLGGGSQEEEAVVVEEAEEETA